MVKPGWKTTEFWLTVLAQVVGFITASGAIADGSLMAQVIAFIAMALSGLGYAVSRGLAKMGNPVDPVEPQE